MVCPIQSIEGWEDDAIGPTYVGVCELLESQAQCWHSIIPGETVAKMTEERIATRCSNVDPRARRIVEEVYPHPT